jgi:hypothetical protein
VSHTFETAKGLRRVLMRLRVSGPHAWEHDPEACDLMVYAARKYEALAIKHRCDPSAGAAAAFEAMFEAMRTYAVRTAVDPWAVVTMAVKVTLIAEERADGLMCSVDQARRPEVSRHHDVRRFCDTEADLPNFLPALAVEPFDPDETPPTGAYEAVDAAIDLFTALGWPRDTATCALDYIAARLIESGCRTKTHAALTPARRAIAAWPLSGPEVTLASAACRTAVVSPMVGLAGWVCSVNAGVSRPSTTSRQAAWNASRCDRS